MVDHTKVNTHDLAAFGQKTFQQTHMSYMSGAMAAQGKIATVMVGQVGSSEALAFQAYYEQYVKEALGHFLKGSPTGIEALGTGAVVMAGNYHSGDLSQAKALNEVNEVFSPAPGRPSIATEAKQRPSTKGTGRGSATELPPPDSSPDDSSADRQRERWQQDDTTPEDEVQEHNNLYQKDETWTPVPLPKYHPDVPSFPRHPSSGNNTHEA